MVCITLLIAGAEGNRVIARDRVIEKSLILRLSPILQLSPCLRGEMFGSFFFAPLRLRGELIFQTFRWR